MAHLSIDEQTKLLNHTSLPAGKRLRHKWHLLWCRECGQEIARNRDDLLLISDLRKQYLAGESLTLPTGKTEMR